MMRGLRRLAALAILVPCAASGADYAGRADVAAFIDDMVARHGFMEAELRRVFAGAQRQETILNAIRNPAEQRQSWSEYRAGMLSERRIQVGMEFWTRHRDTLERARREFGVPEEIIVAILGVETFYGRRMGRWRVADALVTLAFDYPPRAAYFRSELEQFLLLARTSGMPVFAVTGSYAGAIGMPQFMPRSYLHYGLDYDGDGVTDLRGSATDAIGSVANFLRRHGWRTGEAVQMRTAPGEARFDAFRTDDPTPRYPIGDLARAGIQASAPREQPAPETLVSLIPLDPKEIRLGFHNYYVLTRYNRSALYVSAVVDLAAALRRLRPQPVPDPR